MKYSFCFVLTCLNYVVAYSAIKTVSNSSAYPAMYTTILAAVTDAASGDTIYVYPSATAYDANLSISKKLVLIGPGINPLRVNNLPASLSGTMNINGSAANGFVIMGIKFLGVLNIGTSAQVDNVIVSDCMVGQLTYFKCNNIIFENNIVPYSGASSVPIQFIGTTQIIIQNNIFEASIGLKFGQSIVRNNIFASSDANRKAFHALDLGFYASGGIQIHNNIFYKISPRGDGNDGGGNNIDFINQCEYKNNITYLTIAQAPANGSSSGNLNADPLFVNYPLNGAPFSFAYDYRLKPGSPAINYGLDGKDIGMWGGSAPVNAGFEPPIPRIYQLEVNNAIAPAGGTIQLTIKATKAL